MRVQMRRLILMTATALIAGAGAACDDEDPTGADPIVAPTNVVATATSPSSVMLTWNQVPAADSYEVERALATGDFVVIADGVQATLYSDDAVVANTTYRYRVHAIDGGEESAPSGIATVTTPAEGAAVAVVQGITSDRTFHSDTLYVLSGYVKVSNGATLTIEEGTTIVGDTAFPGSSLWILRGSRIEANGTANAPIVFTSMRAENERAPGDWGGIVIIGNAPINRTANPVFTEGPAGVAENYAGGTDWADDSGHLTYVRIEFAGYDISNGAGQELNSLSMYAVGSGTTLDHVQAMAGLDDSFEWWGGAVDARYLISFEAGDDHFDWSEGFRGRVQHLIAIQTDVLDPRPGTGTVSSDPRGFEGDGCDNATPGCTFANTPYSSPVFANFTMVGPGTGVFAGTDGNGAVVRRGSAGTFVNGIVARWPGVGISVRNTESNVLLEADSLYFRNVVLADNGANFEAAGTNFGAALADSATAWSLTTATLASAFTGALPTAATPVSDANLNVVPGTAAATAGATTLDALVGARTAGFFGGTLTGTAYAGAVAPGGTPWYQGWTNFDRD